jgi:subtilase family serine protease
MNMKARKSRRSTWESLEPRQLLSASLADTLLTPNITLSPSATTSTPKGYTPAQIKKAYGFSSISFSGVTGDGTGQTIAIVDAFNDPNISSDLAKFSTTYNLAQANLTVVGQTGSKTSLPKTDAGWAQEISLDVEWAHAIAPGAKILLVEANSDSLNDLLSAVDTARKSAGVSVVSMSWGTSEFAGETAYDSHFTTPAGHTGVTFVSASGDEGSYAGPEWPSSATNVLSVGGTSLVLSSTNTISSETAWVDSTGGVSRFEKASSAESAVTGTTRSSSPDVSYDADPNTGFPVYDSLSYQGSSGWMTFGGTSAGAPQWAALIAIANQGRSLNGAAPLDGASGTIPTLYSLYSNATTYASSFNDITSTTTVVTGGGGFGGFRHGGRSFGRFTTQTVVTDVGYDTVTGLGTPEASAVVSALLGAQSTVTTSVVKASAKAKISRHASHADQIISTTSNIANDTLAITPLPAAANPTVITYTPTANLAADLPKITYILSPVANITPAPVTTPALSTPFAITSITTATTSSSFLTASSLTLPITQTLLAPSTPTAPESQLLQTLTHELESTATAAANLFASTLEDLAHSANWQLPAAALGAILLISWTIERSSPRQHPFNTLHEITPT